jgi:antitoxin YefM
MEILSLSEAKMKFSQLVDRVNATDQEVVITKNGRPAAVLVSPDEFSSWSETLLIQADPRLLEEIASGMRDMKENKASLYTIDELFAE